MNEFLGLFEECELITRYWLDYVLIDLLINLSVQRWLIREEMNVLVDSKHNEFTDDQDLEVVFVLQKGLLWLNVE